MEKDKCSAESHPYNTENLKKLCALENLFKLESIRNNKYYRELRGHDCPKIFKVVSLDVVKLKFVPCTVYQKKYVPSYCQRLFTFL